MTAIGLLVVAAGVALVWAGITDKALLPELRAALANPTPAATAAQAKASAKPTTVAP